MISLSSPITYGLYPKQVQSLEKRNATIQIVFVMLQYISHMVNDEMIHIHKRFQAFTKVLLGQRNHIVDIIIKLAYDMVHIIIDLHGNYLVDNIVYSSFQMIK